MTARFSADDYAAAALALRPQGLAWPLDADAVQVQAIGALSVSLERSDAAAVQLLADGFPVTTEALLPEWEASLGLPDPCAGSDPTDDQRRAQVVARFVGGGGQSAARYIAFAATLGFEIVVTFYRPFKVGWNRIGDPLASDDWAFAWSVGVVANHGTLTVEVLACELAAIAPAGTIFVGVVATVPPAIAPSLDFSDPDNSQYVPLIFGDETA